MLTLTYRYRIYPDATQEQTLIEWMEICRSSFNYALREIKDWCDSRKCPIDRCSLEKEYILPAESKFPSEIAQLNNLPKAKKEFPRLSEVPSQVLQQVIKQLHKAWEYFQERGFGLPRFKKDLSVRVHHCLGCGYTTDRDVAASQNVRNRGVASISTAGLAGIESACAAVLPGVEVTQSRQVAQLRKGKTRKSSK